MKKQFICLANSYKVGGRCIAGIEILNNEVVLINNTPKWIRPISENEHGEVETNLVSHINLLDIVEIDVYENIPSGYQFENALFDTSKIKIIDRFPVILNSIYTTNMNTIFGNRTKVVNSNDIEELNYSLALIEVTEFEVIEIYYDGKPKPKVRLTFTYNSNNYDLPITDPAFLNKFKANKNILSEVSRMNIVLSLGVIHEGLYYKLVAGIIY